MRAHDKIDVLDPEPRRLQGRHPIAVRLVVPGRPVRERLVVADAGVDQDVVVWRLDDIGLEAQDDIAGLRVIGTLFHPRAVFLEPLLRQTRQEFEQRREPLLLLDDAVDCHVADRKFRAHPFLPG